MTLEPNQIQNTVAKIVHQTPIADMHTHLYPAHFGNLLLWGIDELLTYHYLVAEVNRVTSISSQQFWQLSKQQQADLIWDELFVKRSPVSEACRGVLTTLQSLGIDTSTRDLQVIRDYFNQLKLEDYIETVFEKANVSYAVMTNDPFDKNECEFWEKGGNENPRFHPALRVDPLLMGWETVSNLLREQGYEMSASPNDSSFTQIRKFLEKWADKMNPRYMAVSLTPAFHYPDNTVSTQIIDSCIIPFARERNIPFALMLGVKRLINPALKLAGDSVGRCDLDSIVNLCAKYPENRFMCTLLSRENQHEFCVISRKFPNLLPFGCWWFLNNPSLIEEMTRMRLELLGISFVPQHSDARVLDQIIYKWTHSRRIIAKVLTDKYTDLAQTGWLLTEEEIQRDVTRLFSQNFDEFAPAN